VKVPQRRCHVTGVNVPERVEATIQQIDPQDVALTELINEARAEAAVAEEQVRCSTRRPTW
jgi:hypothetical protein